jgi:hypothetical protein
MAKHPESSHVDWSRKLLKPVEVGRRKLRTLDDLRAHLLKLLEEIHEKPAWRAATEAVLAAAETGDVKRAAVLARLGCTLPVHADGPSLAVWAKRARAQPSVRIRASGPLCRRDWSPSGL